MSPLRPWRALRFWAALMSGACWGGLAAADTLEDAVAHTMSGNPDMEDARLAVRVAEQGRVQAFSAYLPSLDLSATYGAREIESKNTFVGRRTRTETELTPSSTTARVTQRLFTGGERGAQGRLARAGVEGARAGLRTAELDLLLAVTEVYVGVRRDEQIVRLRRSYVDSLTLQVSGTQRRLEVGEVTRTDLLQAQSRLAGARALLAGAEAALEQARARYLQIVGVEARDLAPPPPALRPLETLDQIVRYAEQTHPTIEEARQNARGARARIGIERAALLPQISLVGRWDRSEEDDTPDEIQETSSALAQLAIPLFEGGFAWSRTHQSRIQAERARLRVDAQRRAVVAEAISAWSRAEASEQIVASAREQAAAAESAYRGAERERGIGLRSTLDVLDAEREWQDAQIGLARAEADAYINAHALLAAAGLLTEDAFAIDAERPEAR